jgi:hypothetical protein
LEPSEAFGWRLVPPAETRLRWLTYDHLLCANSLGFPGTLYEEGKPADTLRVMTVGDAFTRVEGVDTGEAWPQVPESELRGLLDGVPIGVSNFGMTGHRPNQYAAAVEESGSICQPDLMVVEFFVNDLQDVKRTEDKFWKPIGFGRPSAHSWLATEQLAHLRSYLRNKVIAPLMESIQRRPDPHSHSLGDFRAIEADDKWPESDAVELVRATAEDSEYWS